MPVRQCEAAAATNDTHTTESREATSPLVIYQAAPLTKGRLSTVPVVYSMYCNIHITLDNESNALIRTH